MSITADVLDNVSQVKVSLNLIQTALALTAWQYPLSCNLTNGSYSDYIIVGGGSAGAILANRLSANSNFSVTVLEAGGAPPIEADLPAIFTTLARSVHDWNVTVKNDNYTGQNLVGKSVRIVQGKMLGGCSSANHLFYTQGDKCDYDEWANITGDPSLNYANITKYFRKIENLQVPSILNSSYAAYHGTDGYMKITKASSSVNDNYFDALKELGYERRGDLSGESSLGFSDLLLTIYNGLRRNTALEYLGGEVASRSNLCVSQYSTVTKIIITDNVATGVEMVDSKGNTYVLYAKKEVIISAGAINSPAILLKSGIGPKQDLEALGIEVVADLPVGENLQDHALALLVFKMDHNTATTPASNPHEFPVPAHIGYIPLDSEQSCPTTSQVIGMHVPHDSTALIEMLSIVFGYNNDICDSVYAAASERDVYLAIVQLSKPKSRGKVSLISTNNNDNPLVELRTFNDSSDLTTLAKSLEMYSKILNTTYFKSVNASLVDLGACSSESSDYWKCQVQEYTSSMNHIVGTCAMGSVLDTDMRVKGVNNLRVVDSSAIPNIFGNQILASVLVLAERAAELILQE